MNRCSQAAEIFSFMLRKCRVRCYLIIYLLIIAFFCDKNESQALCIHTGTLYIHIHARTRTHARTRARIHTPSHITHIYICVCVNRMNDSNDVRYTNIITNGEKNIDGSIGGHQYVYSKTNYRLRRYVGFTENGFMQSIFNHRSSFRIPKARTVTSLNSRIWWVLR